MPAAGSGSSAAGRQRRDRAAARRNGRGLAGAIPWSWWGRASGWLRLAIAALVVAAAVVVSVVVLSPAGKPTVDGGRYLAFTSCLLTDSRGLAAQPASSAWAGLEDVAGSTRMQVHYLTVPASATSAAPYLAGLMAQGCDVVVAAGQAQAQAVQADAHLFARVRFLVVGGSASGPNVSVVHGQPGNLRAQVRALTTAALQASH
jgi:basic membrane lipoprotein Med (substrate-binding protein (PBP1-ABC) superfamily)